ncbi:MAG TPA: hypothetical protein VN833_00040 [Candidatus Acidoferrales bacterium]|nr:hypothetical protein [Candidatus Acidoferrales bacterium]
MKPRDLISQLHEPRAVVGWLLVLYLILTITSPAAILYNIGAHVLPQLIGTHRSANILLLSIYCIQSIVLALFSINTGAKLWPVKPDAINLRIGILWPIWARTSRILNFMDARRSTD